jgi:hypothetical protein
MRAGGRLGDDPVTQTHVRQEVCVCVARACTLYIGTKGCVPHLPLNVCTVLLRGVNQGACSWLLCLGDEVQLSERSALLEQSVCVLAWLASMPDDIKSQSIQLVMFVFVVLLLLILPSFPNQSTE